MAINVLTGARARFTLNGVVVALATRVSVNDEINFQPVEVLDNIEVLDHIAVGYTASLNASQVRLIEETVTALGLLPRKGQNAVDHLRNVLTQADLVAQIEDSQTNLVIARAVGVKLSSRSFSVDARGIVNEDLTFVARRLLDEAETV